MKSVIKIALLFFTTLALIACGGGSGGGTSPAPAPAQILSTISIEDATGDEGGMINFKVTANPTIAEPISFDYKIDFENQTASASDLSSATNGRITIAANSNSTTISITIVDDDIRELEETFRIELSNPQPARVVFSEAKRFAIGKITRSTDDGIITSLSIADAQASEEGGNITFTVTSAKLIAEPISFNYQVVFDNPPNSNSATTSDFDLTRSSLSGASTIAANSDSTTISIAIFDDNLREPAETFRIELSNLSSTNIKLSKGTATGTIALSDRINISIADAAGEEGTTIDFKVTSTRIIPELLSFNYQVVFDNPQNSNSATTSDFDLTRSSLNGASTIATNDSSTTISIAIFDDNLREPAETFRIELSNLSSTDIKLSKGTATGTIALSDPINISIADASGEEGATIDFKVTSTRIIPELLSFNYRVIFSNQTNPAATNDFIGQVMGISTIATNDSSTTISIRIKDDVLRESAEIFQIELSNPSLVAIGFTKGTATGTIALSDRAGITSLRIEDASSSEGNNLDFKVKTNLPTLEPISFEYNLSFDNPPSSATTSDFTGSTSGTSTIAANSSEITISIAIKDDNLRESAETFQIELSNPQPSNEATFDKKTATGTIIASDPIEVTISNALSEGQEGASIDFKVSSNRIIAEQISFDYRIALDNQQTNTSANASDFIRGTQLSRGTIATNDSSTTISIGIFDDRLRENSETFMVILSNLLPMAGDVTFGIDRIGMGTISANDSTGIVTISVADAEASEASSTINFKVSSNFTVISDVTFDYEAIVDNPTTTDSANIGDFTAKTGTATISADSTNAMISISLISDTMVEQTETFSLRLTNTSSNATLDSANSLAKGKILNDDVSNVSEATATIGLNLVNLNWTNPSDSLFAGVTITQTTGTTAPNNCDDGIIVDRPATSDTIRMLRDIAHSFRICARSTTGSLSSGIELINIIPEGDDDGDNIFNRIDIDDDNDGLIEIHSETELSNIRHNLAGTSYKDSTAAVGNTIGYPTSATANCKTAATQDIYLCGYELANNISLTSDNWSPIGNCTDTFYVNTEFSVDCDSLAKRTGLFGDIAEIEVKAPFSAIFDGNNFTISNLTIDRLNDRNHPQRGLFGAAVNATIRNLKLTNVSITANWMVGALVGETRNSTIINSSSSGTINTSKYAGGLVGVIRFTTIRDSSSSVNLVITPKTIEIYHRRPGPNQAKYLETELGTGNLPLVAVRGVGGLVGDVENSNIINNYATGNVSYTGNYSNKLGGLIGQIENVRDDYVNIISNYTTGSVSSIGDNNIEYGGLIGRLLITANSHILFTNNYATGSVSSNGSNNSSYGGLVGFDHISVVGIDNRHFNNYATGNVFSQSGTSNRSYGGLIGETLSGRDDHAIPYINSYATGNVYSLSTGADNINYGGLVGTQNASIVANAYSAGGVFYKTGNPSANNTYGLFIGSLSRVHNKFLNTGLESSRVYYRNNATLSGFENISKAIGLDVKYDPYTEANGGVPFVYDAYSSTLTQLRNLADTDTRWNSNIDNLFTQYCDLNQDASIDTSERVEENRVWVYAAGKLPALRCTPGGVERQYLQHP